MIDTRPIQTLTAYRYCLIDIKSKEVIKIGTGENDTFNFIKLLQDFSKTMFEFKITDAIKKVAKLESSVVSSDKSYLHFRVSSGQYGQKFSAVDIYNSSNVTKLDIDKAMCRTYNVVFYTKENLKENICIFHRHGKGGCKTAFMPHLESFLRTKGLRIEMSAIAAPNSYNLLNNNKKTKIKLIKHTEKIKKSTDVSENITKRKVVNNTEMEITINLRNTRMQSVFNSSVMEEIISKKSKISDFYELPSNFEYDESIIFMDIGDNKVKQFNLDSLGSLLCQHDITKELKFDSENEPLEEMLIKEFHLYYELLKRGD